MIISRRSSVPGQSCPGISLCTNLKLKALTIANPGLRTSAAFLRTQLASMNVGLGTLCCIACHGHRMGHDKLYNIVGFPIWAVFDYATSKWLGASSWVVPSNRMRNVIDIFSSLWWKNTAVRSHLLAPVLVTFKLTI